MTSFGDDVNLKINPEYASIMTPLTEWEYERLKKSKVWINLSNNSKSR